MPDAYSDDDYEVEDDELVSSPSPDKQRRKGSSTPGSEGSAAAFAKAHGRPVTAPSASASSRAPALTLPSDASAAVRSSSARLKFDGLPVELPAAALRPKLVIAGASGAGRDASTLIIHRSSRGQAALKLRNAEPTEAQKALRDLSHLHPPEVKTWRREYLNELAYAITSKEKAASKRKAEIAKRDAEERAAREKAMLGGRRRKPEDRETEGGSDAFYDRQDLAARRAVENRTLAQQEAAFNAHPVKKFCPKCGVPQTFQDWAAGIARCQKDSCGGAMFRPKRLWSEVQESFLKRWDEFHKRREANLAKLDADTMPPFRLLTRTVFDKETGEMTEEPVEYAAWDDVADDFFERQEACLERLKARDQLAAEAAAKAAEKITAEVLKAKPYKFSKPLPSFEERQAQSLARRNMTFEERMAEMADR